MSVELSVIEYLSHLAGAYIMGICTVVILMIAYWLMMQEVRETVREESRKE